MRMNTMIFFMAASLLKAITVVGKINWDSRTLLLAKVNISHVSRLYDSLTEDFLDDYQIVKTWYFPPLSDSRSKQYIQVYGQNKNMRECMMNLNIEDEIRSPSYNNVLIPVRYYPGNIDGDRSIKLLLLNTENCKQEFLYDHPIPSSSYYFIASDDPKEERFSIVTQGEIACQGYNWCRLHFNPLYQKIEPLDFDFPSSPLGLKIESAVTYDINLFTARFYDEVGTYRVRLYDFSANRTGPLCRELLAVTPYQTDVCPPGKPSCGLIRFWFDFKFSGLSFCWRSTRKDQLPNVVFCSRFGKDGTLIFNKTIAHRNSMSLLHVATVPGGLVLISTKDNCDYKIGECNIIQVDVITRNFGDLQYNSDIHSPSNLEPLKNEFLQIKQRQYIKNYETCYRENYKIRLSKRDGSFEVNYLCISSDHFSTSSFFVD